MARSADKNDVDISQLFKWTKEVTLSDPVMDVEVTVYLRLVGDADMTRARAYGYRKAAKLRKALRKEGTDERIAFMGEIGSDFADKESLVQTIILLRTPDFRSTAISTTEYAEPKEPKSTASQEEFEKYQEALDNYPDEFTEAVEKTLNGLIKRDRKVLTRKHEETLYELYEQEVISRLCSEEMYNKYYDMCVHFGTYKDKEHNKPAFKSVEDFENLRPQLRNELLENYKELEIGMDTLKKSPEATE